MSNRLNTILSAINKALIFLFSLPKPVFEILSMIPFLKHMFISIKGYRTQLISLLLLLSGALDAFTASGGLAEIICNIFGFACEDSEIVGAVEMISGYLMGYMRIITNTPIGQKKLH